jgi:hypothetical protein
MKETLTRKQLYDLIWSKPLTKVQLELGLTYAQLKRICNEYKLPIPGSGFWVKKEFGKPVAIAPLIEYPDINEEIQLVKRNIEMLSVVKVIVPKVVRDWHPLVARFRDKYVVYQNELKKGSWSNALRGELNIQVKDSHISRATRIFDTVIKIVESKGHSIFIDHFGTNIKIQEHTYQLSIRTKNKRVIDEDSNYSYQSTKLIPLDILIFKIARIYSFEFADTPNKPLEDKIESIIARLELLSIQDTKMKEDARRQNQIYQAQREQREAIIKAREQEKAKFESLVQDAENWNKAVLISKYLDKMGAKPDLTIEELEYIAWGRTKVFRLNPLNFTQEH